MSNKNRVLTKRDKTLKINYGNKTDWKTGKKI